MRRLFVVLLYTLLWGSLHSLAQSEGSSAPYTVRVVIEAESAFARQAPSLESPISASLFKDDVVEIVARNLDGTWYLVRRPNRLNTLGWIFSNLYERTQFMPENLPLGDFTTGATGPNPLQENTPYAVYMNEGAALRTLPSRLGSERILNIPPLVTIPVLSRTSDGAWFKVNYLGHEGWIIAFTARNPRSADKLAIPVDPIAYVSPETFVAQVIPPEIQQAQLDRLRAYIATTLTTAQNLEAFWWRVYRGEVMPCSAPERATFYPYSEQDVKELPEIQRVTSRIGRSVGLLNNAIEPLLSCGVMEPSQVIQARNDATNARVILEATEGTLEAIEFEINEFRPGR